MSSSSGSPPISIEDLEYSSESSSSCSKPQRSDGRRAVELSNSPNLSKVSKLYGKPSWWGEEKATEKDNDQEFEFVKPGSQILRDYDRRVRSPSNCEDTAASRPQRLSASEDLRVQAMSNSRERDCPSPASTWTVDLGDSTPAVTKKRPSRFDNTERRPRSADPSPNRSPQIKKDLLPVTTSSSLKRSSSTRRSPSSSPRRSPVMTRRPQNMTIKKKGGEGQSSSEQALSRSKTITKKPLTYASASLTRSKTTVKKSTPTHHHTAAGTGGRVRRSSLEKVSQATSGKTATTKQVCVGSNKEVSSKKTNITSSLNDTYVTDPLSSSLDESQSTTQSEASLSSLSQLTAPETPASHQRDGLKSSSSTSKIQQRRGEGEGGGGGSGDGVEARPNSARKQWASDQSQV